ncbi:MAG: hypothetical protein ACXWC9_02030 [Pseudobdellovibrionaceae bacterium]
MAKIHIGLVAENKALESEIKQAAEQFGGAYVHQAKNVFELLQKLAMQKVQLMMLNLPATGESSDFGSAFSFIRSKKDLAKVPMCVLTDTARLETNFLLLDPLVRSFPLSSGLFVSLLSMMPLVQDVDHAGTVISEQWIQSEFLDSLKSKTGQDMQFAIRTATEDERRQSFYSQQADEIRSHLGWFKFTVRMLETPADGVSKMFQGLSRDTVEEFSQILLSKVVEEFNMKVHNDFAVRGAVHLPPIEKLNPVDRKWVYSHVQHQGYIFEAPECQILLEVSRYI